MYTILLLGALSLFYFELDFSLVWDKSGKRTLLASPPPGSLDPRLNFRLAEIVAFVVRCEWRSIRETRMYKSRPLALYMESVFPRPSLTIRLLYLLRQTSDGCTLELLDTSWSLQQNTAVTRPRAAPSSWRMNMTTPCQDYVQGVQNSTSCTPFKGTIFFQYWIPSILVYTGT